MFLDDELNQIWEQNPDMPLTQLSKLLLKACINRFGDPTEDYIAWVNNVKRAELSWQLFAKKHPVIKPDGLRIIMVEALSEKFPNRNINAMFNWK